MHSESARPDAESITGCGATDGERASWRKRSPVEPVSTRRWSTVWQAVVLPGEQTVIVAYATLAVAVPELVSAAGP
jgi:hypothetical protein